MNYELKELYETLDFLKEQAESKVNQYNIYYSRWEKEQNFELESDSEINNFSMCEFLSAEIEHLNEQIKAVREIIKEKENEQ